MPTFSIVTVVLNEHSGLEHTAQSLAKQTFTNFEWIVIDGASLEGQRPERENLNPRPSVLISERDEGIYDAMNKGWRRARGEWLLFLNAGDALCSERTLEDVALKIDGTTARWAFGMVRNVDAGGNVFGIQNASPFNRMGHALGNTTVPHQATFMRRSLLHELNGFRLDFDTAADQELIYRAARLGRPDELVWPIADFRVGGRGMQVSTLQVVTMMRRARDANDDRYRGSRLADGLLTAGVYVSKAAKPALAWFQR